MAIQNHEENFKSFKTVGTTSTNGFLETLELFEKFCQSASVDTSLKGPELYQNIKAKLQSEEAKPLWKCLEKRGAQAEYLNENGQLACKGKEILIVGAGPCGLRMAIECAFLGASCTVIDMRPYISRNNVLHLWPFVIQDIKSIGGKVFNPKFCVGAIDHVSIKRLQLLLLKICLMMGIRVYTPVQFKKILNPNEDTGTSWRIEVTPENHILNKTDFDFIIGANGKNNSLPDFTRKTMRGKLAIAITANFVNKQTSADARVTEIGGLSYIFDQEFFNGLKDKTGADLENFVYFKDDTHYFVMTPKKSCLLSEGVIKQDCSDVRKLLSRENINKAKLHSFAREVVLCSTNNQLKNPQFAVNHHNEEDIAIFDFTSISMANHSCYVKEMHGKTLVQCIVGDSLLEPFWPTGTGCARGFLGVFDAAWFIRQWCDSVYPKLQIIAERETIFRLLSQTKPESSMSIINKYTIDPQTRYGTKLKVKTLVQTRQVQHLYKKLSGTETDQTQNVNKDKIDNKIKHDIKKPDLSNVNIDHLPTVQAATKDDNEVERPAQMTSLKRSRQGSLNPKFLLKWYQEKLEPFYKFVAVKDLNQSWINGVALCALVQLYRPSAVSVQNLEDDAATTLQIAFMLIEQEFGVSPMFSAYEISEKGEVDKLAMLSYLAQIKQVLENEPVSKAPKLANTEQPRNKDEEYDEFLMGLDETSSSPMDEEEQLVTSMSPHGMLVKMSQKTEVQVLGLKQSVENAQAWMGSGKSNDDEKMDTLRKTILMSTNRMPSKLKKASNKKQLTRKRVLFKEPPPSVSKFRSRESQDIDIGGTGMAGGLQLSETNDNKQDGMQIDSNADMDNTTTSGPPSLAACSAVPMSERIANFQQTITEKQKSKAVEPQSPSFTKVYLGRAKGKDESETTIKAGRPSLAYCRGIAGDRIKNLQNKWQRSSPVIHEESPNQNEQPQVSSPSKVNSDSNENVAASNNEPTPKGKSKSGNFLDKLKLKRLGKKKNRVTVEQSNVTTQDESQLSEETPSNPESSPSRARKDIQQQPNSTPPSYKKGLQQVPSKMFESVSYVACQDRAKKNIDLFERKFNPSKGNEVHEERSNTVQDNSASFQDITEEQDNPSNQRNSLLEALEDTKEVSVAERISSYIQDCQEQAGSDICCICEKKLYLIDRYSAHGKSFHRNCYRCKTCNTLLRLGNSLMKKLPEERVEFYCFSHAYMAGVFDVEWKGKDEGNYESVTDGGEPTDVAQGEDQDFNFDLSEQRESKDYSSSDEESLGDDEFDALVAANNSGYKSTKLRNQSMRSQKSLRLLVADEIQRGLDEVDADEEELEKEGHAVEDKLRNRQSACSDDEVMEEWLEVLRKKKELVDRESKLMLKKKLIELQDRQSRLQLLLTSLGMGANTDQVVHNEMLALEQDTEDLELEMECLVTQMKSLSTYLESESNV